MAYPSTDFLRRLAVSCVTVAGLAANETYDVEIPKGLDDFWNNIDADGDAIRVCSADGVTPVSYGWRSFDRATRTGVLALESVATGSVADRLLLFWLYYRPGPSVSVTDGSSAITSKDRDGYIELSAPSTYLVNVQPPGERATAPRAAFAKSEEDLVYVWLDVQGLLESAARPWYGKPYMEEPGRTAVQVLDNTGTPVASPMTFAGGLRWGTYRRRGDRFERAVLRVPIYGGTSGETYSIECQFETAHPAAAGAWRSLAPRVGFRVQNLLET